MQTPGLVHRKFFPWLAVAGSTVLALVVVEIGLRLSGATFLPTLSTIEFGWPDPQVIRDAYREDPQLFWVPKAYPAALASVRHDLPLIVYMGDSCTEFGGYSTMFTERLREKFPGKPFESFSAGVGGWSSSQGLRQFRRDVMPLGPRVVTVYYGWNDHWTGFGVTDAEAGQVADASGPLGSLRVGQLLFFVRLQLRHLLARDRPNRVSEQEFHDNLASIVELGKQHGIVTVLLTAPTSHQEGEEPKYLAERWLRDLKELVPLHQAYVEQVRRVAAEEEVPLCDLAAAFAAMPRADLVGKYFQADGIHLGEEGNRKIAELLFVCFEREHLFTRALGLTD